MGRKAACAPEREKQPSPSPPLPPIPSGSLAALSVDLGAFHAETVGKGGERGREGRRDAVVVVGESRSLRALALEKAATALALQEEIWFSHRCIQGARTPR